LDFALELSTLVNAVIQYFAPMKCKVPFTKQMKCKVPFTKHDS